MGKVPINIPRRGDSVKRLEPIAETMRRVMALEKRVSVLAGEVQGLRHRSPDPLTPFQGWISPTQRTHVRIGAHRAEDWYPWLDTIYVQGTDLTLNKAAAENVTISEDSAVYYEIDVSATPITATLAAAAAVPDDTDTLRYVVLGKALWDGDDAILWYKQQQFGNIIVNPEYLECLCVEELNDLTDVEIT